MFKLIKTGISNELDNAIEASSIFLLDNNKNISSPFYKLVRELRYKVSINLHNSYLQSGYYSGLNKLIKKIGLLLEGNDKLLMQIVHTYSLSNMCFGIIIANKKDLVKLLRKKINTSPDFIVITYLLCLEDVIQLTYSAEASIDYTSQTAKIKSTEYVADQYWHEFSLYDRTVRTKVVDIQDSKNYILNSLDGVSYLSCSCGNEFCNSFYKSNPNNTQIVIPSETDLLYYLEKIDVYLPGTKGTCTYSGFNRLSLSPLNRGVTSEKKKFIPVKIMPEDIADTETRVRANYTSKLFGQLLHLYITHYQTLEDRQHLALFFDNIYSLIKIDRFRFRHWPQSQTVLRIFEQTFPLEHSVIYDYKYTIKNAPKVVFNKTSKDFLEYVSLVVYSGLCNSVLPKYYETSLRGFNYKKRKSIVSKFALVKDSLVNSRKEFLITYD